MKLLPYDKAREVIQDGDIIFFKGKRKYWLHTLIMTSTHSNLFHVGIAFWVGEGENRRCLLVEAHGSTPRRIVTLSFYEEYEMVVVTPPIQWKEASTAAFQKIGTAKYGYLSAFYIGLRDIMLRYFDYKLPARDFPREVCSEFVAKVYQFVDPIISPQRLYDILMMDQKERGD